MMIKRYFLALVSLLMLGTPTDGQTLKDHDRDFERSKRSSFQQQLAPFYHGVASGDPRAASVILWTRVTPADSTKQALSVDWLIARDTALTNIVDSGTATTNPAEDYTVHVEANGLRPATTYYYAFRYQGEYSLTGRTRTTPTGKADQLRFAVVSCSNFQAGYFNAYGHIAQRNDLDALIHLGDYIYEYGEGGYGNDSLVKSGSRDLKPDKEITSLADYRARYSTYRLDSNLIRAHQQHPIIPVWDDHESANDAYTDGAENHDPAEEGPWDKRKSVAKRTYFDWMPVREEQGAIYRTISYGNLADLFMLDTRLQGRDRQILDVTDPRIYDPNRTILGTQQEQWFKQELKQSDAQWKVIGNQVVFSPLNVGWAALQDSTQTFQGLESIFLDIWDGYPAERTSIVEFLDQQGIDNTVFVTGDFHTSFAFDVTDSPAVVQQQPLPTGDTLFRYNNTSSYDPASGSGAVAVEFVTPSITAANFDENIGPAAAQGFESQFDQPIEVGNLSLGNPNPHMHYTNLTKHGYMVLNITPQEAQADWYHMDQILEPGSDEQHARGAVTQDGANHLTTTTEPAAAKDKAPALAPLLPQSAATGASLPRQQVVFGVYPNPADDHLTIHFSQAKQAAYQLQITDIQGRVVKQQAFRLPKGVYSQQLPVQSLEAGTYILRLIPESGGETDQSFQHKFVKP